MCSINNEIDYIICGIEIIKLEMDFIIMEENIKIETGYNAEWCMSRIEEIEIVLAEYILYQYWNRLYKKCWMFYLKFGIDYNVLNAVY